MRLIDLDLLKGKVEAMQACEPHFDCNFLNDAMNPSTEWECIEDMIDSIPVINAQPVKQGKWSEYSRNALETYIECTNCCVASRPIHLQMVTRNGSGLPDYCPNCGAKMDGGDADETE